MPFKWDDFLDLARLLYSDAVAVQPPIEARLRTVISRAYYAAFGFAREHAQKQGFAAVETAEDHIRLRDHFEKTGRRDVARQLSRLRQWRNQADYQSDAGNVTMMAKESLAEAHRIVRKLGGS